MSHNGNILFIRPKMSLANDGLSREQPLSKPLVQILAIPATAPDSSGTKRLFHRYGQWSYRSSYPTNESRYYGLFGSLRLWNKIFVTDPRTRGEHAPTNAFLGGISKGDQRRFLQWAKDERDLPVIEELISGAATAEYEPSTPEMIQQTDEAHMGFTYKELGIFGRKQFAPTLVPGLNHFAAAAPKERGPRLFIGTSPTTVCSELD
ncbi:MAG: hypothetical protein Q9184_002208 [Pyrenodesmia sp. 2 TL-2023]